MNVYQKPKVLCFGVVELVMLGDAMNSSANIQAKHIIG
jgi:hypothetical protein